MLEQALNKALANTFAFYLKIQGFHWNVEGPDFYQFHNFFQEIYTDVYGAIDPLAEHIRACGYYAPGTMSDMLRLTDITETNMNGQPAVMMTKNLLQANELVILSLYQAYQAAENAKELGLANFIQDRIDIHNKHSWFLKSQSK
jgi:starvation-inducible DNA-binding protein